MSPGLSPTSTNRERQRNTGHFFLSYRMLCSAGWVTARAEPGLNFTHPNTWRKPHYFGGEKIDSKWLSDSPENAQSLVKSLVDSLQIKITGLKKVRNNSESC
mgnify:FL=1